MPLRIAVDASPLILLGSVGQLELLRSMASRVVVPRSVLAEMDAGDNVDASGREVRRLKWLTIVAAPPMPPDLAAWDLGRGESKE